MTSVTDKLNLVEQVVSEEDVPSIIRTHYKRVKKETNGNFVSAMYAITDGKIKWVSVQRNGCPITITVKSNYLKEFDSIIGNANYVERKFVENISNGDFEKYKLFKFTK
ncbi:MAG: hypothetical protein ABFQ65_00820 [Nanoarchaeota archaeon]